MPDIDWSDVFGPAPQRQSTTSNVKDLGAAFQEFRSISDRALKLRNRLTRSRAISLEDNALVAPLLKEVEEAQIVSQNADAVLKAVDEILREKREKRIAEESIVRWPWPDTKMTSMHARPSERMKDHLRQGADVKAEAKPQNSPKQRSSTSTMQRRSGDFNCSAHHGLSNAPHAQGEPRAELQSVVQPRPQSCVKNYSSSSYSRSTNDTASQHSARRELGASTGSTKTNTASDDSMIAWPWPSTIVQAATARSSTGSSLGRRNMVSPPPTTCVKAYP